MSPRKNILVVDDDVDIRDTLSIILDEAGFSVSCAGNGREALTYLRGAETLPALILLDLMMPVMTGPQFREEQRRDVFLASIPVVVMSAAIDAKQQAKALEVSGLIPKPFLLQGLLDMIERHCD